VNVSFAFTRFAGVDAVAREFPRRFDLFPELPHHVARFDSAATRNEPCY